LTLTYIGTYIAGKHLREVVASSKQTAVDESEWIKIPNHHLAIVTKEEFDKVQEIYARRKHCKVRKTRKYLLFGLVFCGCCGRSMIYGRGTNPVFRCIYTNADPNASCYKMKVNATTLESAILSIVKKQAEVVLNANGISELQEGSLGQLQISEYESNIRQLTEQSQKFYEQFVTGQIEHETYMLSKSECSKQIGKLNTQIDLLKQSERIKFESQKLVALAKEASSIIESDSQQSVIESVVEKILVFPKKQIEITWKFENFG